MATCGWSPKHGVYSYLLSTADGSRELFWLTLCWSVGFPMTAICISCSNPISLGAAFCSRCGAAVAPSSVTPTVLDSRSSPSVSSPRSLDQGRFTAGTILAGRHRIIGLLGRGGMGEVYRADDLTLGHPVALKFLPQELARDPERLSRLIGEVRIARQVSHPNVCRVYDIGEVDGHRFISMEYVDGEDLAALLRRIGRLPRDKSVEVGRQICAGLAAAHDKGVIHRDLKPANVMIDGRGKVRITDFGLASAAGELRDGDMRVGTPAYMSPEQLAGREVSTRSDIYALGLVLYEMFTGKAAFKSGSLAELTRSREEIPASPSSLVRELDPAVERAILRCLEKDPRSRPASALAVAAALPGGDPLAAALAAGETPAPEVVAAAGEEGGLRPALAWTCLAGTLGGLALCVVLGARFSLVSQVPLEKSPDVLQERAREIVRKLGHASPAVDTAWEFEAADDYLTYVREHDSSLRRWDRLTTGRPAALRFWFRQSPQPMVARPGFTTVKPDDPPLVLSGMAMVTLDSQGRLIGLEFVPPQKDESEESGSSPDWPVLFAEAGLDMAQFTPVKPVWSPPMYSDVRMAWEGSWPGTPDIRIHLEAAGYKGRPVYFRIVEPWTRPERMEPAPLTLSQRLGQNLFVALTLVGLVGALFLARRNLKLGRGDRSGAFKIAGLFLGVHLIVWLSWAHHVPVFADEWRIFQLDTGYTLFLAGLLWLLYIGLEPFVRRRWPDAMISWSRLLAGRVRDPLVGRDILIGCVLGIALNSVGLLSGLVPGWLGLPPLTPFSGGTQFLAGLGYSAAAIADTSIHAVLNSMLIVFIFLLLRIVLRKDWLAAGAFIIISACFGFQADYPVISIPVGVLGLSAAAFVMIRFGLLAVTVGFILGDLSSLLLTTHFTAWYASSTLLATFSIVALALYAFYHALAGRPMFGAGLIE